MVLRCQTPPKDKLSCFVRGGCLSPFVDRATHFVRVEWTLSLKKDWLSSSQSFLHITINLLYLTSSQPPVQQSHTKQNYKYSRLYTLSISFDP